MNVENISDETKSILVQWQAAKIQYDQFNLFTDFIHLSCETEERQARRTSVMSEYYAAKDALKAIREPELADIVGQAHPEAPDVDLETRDGYAIWCEAEHGMKAAEQKLFDISLEIEDLFPNISKMVQ